MGFDDDLFGPYSPETKGDLEKYLDKYDGHVASNHFYGPEYFFIIKDKGFIEPNFTLVRINRSPLPDLSYFVDENYMLKSEGEENYNMSCINADKGIYNPKAVLKDMHWSIYNLDL